MHRFSKPLIGLLAIASMLVPLLTGAQDQQVINLNAQNLRQKVELFFSPQSGTFQEGSTFEVPVYINTEGASINTVSLHLSFDASKLRIIKPAGGTSIIGLWVGAPSYDNSRGTLDIAGTIPNGIKTDSGLIVTITFEAIAPGGANVAIADTSQVLLNDGLGSPALFETNRASFIIAPQAPEGPIVSSETHALQDRWYNNRNVALAWEGEPDAEGYSYVTDTIPTTIPPDTIVSTSSATSLNDVQDGVWYFHIKERRHGVWGGTTHFAIHIDATSPADFKPAVQYLGAAVVSRYLVSFFTTDNLSGIDHYEVGVIDRTQPTTVSPVFERAESPYQIPFETDSKLQVVVRAFDKAGNVREASLSVDAPFFLMTYLHQHPMVIWITALFLIALMFLFQYRRALLALVKDPKQPNTVAALSPRAPTRVEIHDARINVP